jgi:oligoendopeptidase F
MIDTATERRTGAEDILWDLSIFYSGVDDQGISDDMAATMTQAEGFAAKYKGRAGTLSAKEMRGALHDLEELHDRVGRIGTFVYLHYSTNQNDPAANALLARFEEYAADLQGKLIFFRLEWLAISDEDARKVLDDLVWKDKPQYRHYLEAERRFKPYQLSETEEQLLLEKAVTGRQAWQRFYDQLVASIRVNFRGEQITLAEAVAKIEDPDRDVRRDAFDAVTQGWRENTLPITYLFNVLTADKAQEDKKRGYKSWISWRNLDNKVSDEVVDALVKAVTSSYDLVERHYRLKRQILGFDLVEYDRHAPLPIEGGERKYTWEEARDIVLEAYRAFSPRMADVASRFFDERWIHAPLMEGKDGGAFSATSVPSAHPFIMMNFTGEASDVGTLAHEMGHGVHQYLASEAQGLLGAETPVTISEMASTFGEMLVFDDLMKREDRPEVKLLMLSRELEYRFATVYRQIAFNRFEDRLHNTRREEGELSTEQITELWLGSIRPMFGDGLQVRDDYGQWWSQVLHFVHIPGYVYGYAFGQLLVMSLYNLYKQRGESFVPQFEELLAAGGSDYPDALLAKIGVDLKDPAFWNEGIEALRELVEQEEELARQVFPEKLS